MASATFAQKRHPPHLHPQVDEKNNAKVGAVCISLWNGHAEWALVSLLVQSRIGGGSFGITAVPGGTLVQVGYGFGDLVVLVVLVLVGVYQW